MKIIALIASMALLLSVNISAQVPFHDVLKLDSINLNPSNIRVNQVGYAPKDEEKRAFVMAYKNYTPEEGTKFFVINASTKEVVHEGELEDSGYDFGRGNFYIKAYYNSITPWNPPYPLTSNYGEEHIYVANFGEVTDEGRFNLVCEGDTSHPFVIDPYVYNNLFTTQLKFLAFQRCGEATWAHEACHVHDGEAVNHDLRGGWHDCGDHPKLSLTMGYTAMMISLLTATLEDKLDDRWNAPMNDSLFTDGIPDLLYETWNVSKYFMRLYRASKKDGIFDKQEMYHVIGDIKDHAWWGKPEWQETLPPDQGGRPRPVKKAIGPEVAAKFGATLAYFSQVWKKYDKNFADSCLMASEDIYENMVIKNLSGNSGKDHDGMYQSNGLFEDEIASHLVALLWATKDKKYKEDLLENTAYGKGGSVEFNADLFYAGWFAHRGAVQFHPGGWPQDWENVYAYVLYAFKKLILTDFKTAKLYGFSEEEYNELSIRTAHAYLKNLSAGGLIKDERNAAAGGNFTAEPYNLPNFNMAWGFNRYNLGMSITGFLFVDAFGDQKFEVTKGLNKTNVYQGKEGETIDFSGWKWLEQQAVRHLDYILGVNPWDISFVMGTGSKTLNHPHNRTANAEMSNGSAPRYDYTVPIGALMGGQMPVAFEDDSGSTKGGLTLNEDAQNYIVDETCVDYSMVLMAMTAVKAEVLPPDTLAPQIFNHGWSQIDSQSVLVSWENNELSKDLLIYSRDPNAVIRYLKEGEMSSTLKLLIPKKQPDAISDFQKKQSVIPSGLVKDIDYYYAIITSDVKGNTRNYDNGGDLFKFYIKDINYEISGVTICNLTATTAEITWVTNEKAPSTVYYKVAGTNDMDTVLYDDESPSTMYHKVTLKNLVPDTDYEYWVKSGTTTDGPYTFTTQFDFAKLEINASMEESGNFWFTVLNKENIKNFQDLEFRIYVPKNVTEGHYWDVQPALYYYNGMVSSTNPLKFTKSLKTDGDHKYISLTTNPEFVFQANGMLKLKLDISQMGEVSYDNLSKGWSFREHGEDEKPFPPYVGIGPAESEPNESNVIRDAPPEWAGKPVLLPTNYIVVYHKGHHVFGYYPDYDFDEPTLQEEYDVTVKITEPINTLFGNSTTIVGEDETKKVTIKGSVSILGQVTGNYKKVGAIKVNEETADFAVSNSGKDVEFTCDVTLKEGLNNVVVYAIDDNDGSGASCNSGSKSLVLTYKRGNVTKSDLKVVNVGGAEFAKDENGDYKSILGESLIYLTVSDSDENIDDYSIEKVVVTLESPTDTETVYLSEDDMASGFFSNFANALEGILISDVPAKTGDKIISAKKDDIITVTYQDDDSEDDRSIKRIRVLEDFPEVYFIDSADVKTDWYLVETDKIGLELRDKLTFEDSTKVTDEIELTIYNKDKSDSENFTLVRHPLKKFYYVTDSTTKIPMVVASEGNRTPNDGIMSVQLDDSLNVSYTVNKETTADTVRLAIGDQPSDLLDSLEYIIAPNPILISQFKDGKYRIVLRPRNEEQQTTKFSIELLKNLGVEDITASIYDINGYFVKQLPPLTLKGLDSGEEMLELAFDTHWDGKSASTSRYVSSGVYIMKFVMKYKKGGEEKRREEIVDFYIIKDLED